ncbi:MAG: 16S rRNA (adenine(1518)-N(6)/adenine(1519)-N(6))-dimethyltransferase RsmA [Desulfobaccales bacterium]
MSSSSPRTVLRRLGLKPEKARGQHFLLHPHQSRRIVAALELAANDLVVEIGPGLGALTLFLAQEAGRVVALELDPALAAYLREELFVGNPRVEIRCQDVLDFDFPALARQAARPLVVAGNLPYQITSPLLFKLAAAKDALSRAMLMMQKEVGLRLTAAPGTKDYGILSVLMQYHFTLSRLFSLDPANFYPPPQVTSVVMRFIPRQPEPQAQDEEFFAQVVKAAFAARRKTLRNTLAARGATLGLDQAEVLAALHNLDIDPGRRGETLTVSQFVLLSNDLRARRAQSR